VIVNSNPALTTKSLFDLSAICQYRYKHLPEYQTPELPDDSVPLQRAIAAIRVSATYTSFPPAKAAYIIPDNDNPNFINLAVALSNDQKPL
jgi:hypothetical protein